MAVGLTCSCREDDPLRHPGCAVGDRLYIFGRVDGVGKTRPGIVWDGVVAPHARGQARTQRPARPM
jgi:hypothetical protein